jgi:hypothetical protein
MLIFNEESQPIILAGISDPNPTEYFWVLDLEMMDYTLASLNVLEEIVCPTVTLEIAGSAFDLPASWNLLIYDEDTSQLDTTTLANAAGEHFGTVIHGPDCSTMLGLPMKIVDYKPSFKHVGPSLNKNQMLCHPIAQNLWIHVSPTDVYNKYLKTATLGDLF